jgi:hypothetical protein
MTRRPRAPIIEGMTEDRHDGRRAPLPRIVGTVLLIVLVSLMAHDAPWPSLDLPRVDLPSVPFPDLPAWVGPVFRWARFAVIGVLIALAAVEASERRERS